MYYQVSKEFFEKLPNACFGAVAVRGLDNTRAVSYTHLTLPTIA